MKKLFLFGLALFLLIFFVVPVYLGYGQEEPIVEWIARYNGPGNEEDSAYAIAVGPSGNVYVTGYSYGSGTDHDYATIRYDRDGNEVWVARYNGTGNDIDIAYAAWI